jgi:putative addiction module killer protein
MATFHQTEEFVAWINALKDLQAKAKITTRIRMVTLGNFGDCAPVGEGVSEMRLHFGPGYRLYFMRTGDVIYLLLIGGDKSSQKKDIKRAIEMAHGLERGLK